MRILLILICFQATVVFGQRSDTIIVERKTMPIRISGYEEQSHGPTKPGKAYVDTNIRSIEYLTFSDLENDTDPLQQSSIYCTHQGDTITLKSYMEKSFTPIEFCEDLYAYGNSYYRIRLNETFQFDSLEILREDPCDFWKDRLPLTNAEIVAERLKKVQIIPPAEKQTSFILSARKDLRHKN